MSIRFFALIVALCVSVASLEARQTYVAQVKLTITNTASGFTASDINAGQGHPAVNSAVCTLTASSGAITYRIDGTTTTTTTGIEVQPGSTLVITGGSQYLLAFSAIRTGSTSGDLRCVLSSSTGQ